MHNKAFTLVELMIVISIIGILAAALFPSLTGYLARGRDSRRIADVQNIQKSILLYQSDFGKFPSVETYNTGVTSGFVSDCKGYPNTLLQLEQTELITKGLMNKAVQDPDGNWPLCYMYRSSDYVGCPGLNNGYLLVFGTENQQYPQLVKYMNQGENGTAGRYCYSDK